jgi:hypothetical protein
LRKRTQRRRKAAACIAVARTPAPGDIYRAKNAKVKSPVHEELGGQKSNIAALPKMPKIARAPQICRNEPTGGKQSRAGPTKRRLSESVMSAPRAYYLEGTAAALR